MAQNERRFRVDDYIEVDDSILVGDVIRRDPNNHKCFELQLTQECQKEFPDKELKFYTVHESYLRLVIFSFEQLCHFVLHD